MRKIQNSKTGNEFIKSNIRLIEGRIKVALNLLILQDHCYEVHLIYSIISSIY